MPSLYIVVPAYNEGDNIEALVSEWHPIVAAVSPDSRLLIINDGSRDNTLGILTKLKETFPQLEVASKPNGGHGSTIYYGYTMALEKGAGYIFQIDADRQTLPEEFAPFWECREQFDASIGLRSNRQDGLGRVFVTKVLGLSLQVMFGVDIPDANTPFRLLRRDVLAQALALVPDGHKLTNVLLSVVLTKQKRSINWLPITFRMRQGGVNSINFRRIFHIGLKSMYDFWRFREVLRNR